MRNATETVSNLRNQVSKADVNLRNQISEAGENIVNRFRGRGRPRPVPMSDVELGGNNEVLSAWKLHAAIKRTKENKTLGNMRLENEQNINASKLQAAVKKK